MWFWFFVFFFLQGQGQINLFGLVWSLKARATELPFSIWWIFMAKSKKIYKNDSYNMSHQISWINSTVPFVLTLRFLLFCLQQRAMTKRTNNKIIKPQITKSQMFINSCLDEILWNLWTEFITSFDSVSTVMYVPELIEFLLRLMPWLSGTNVDELCLGLFRIY